MADQFFITRADMQALTSLLREIPELVEDLAITLTRQDNVGAGVRVASGSDEQPLPMNFAASDAHDLLRSTLAAWVRHVTDTPGMAYGGPPGTAGIATWLADHVTSLAMTEGCEEAYDEISHAMGECRRACDRHEDRAVLPLNATKLAAARAQELGARECAQVAKCLGEPYSALTKRRVLYLWGAGKLNAAQVTISGRVRVPTFVLGQVLDAHTGADR
ncbi:hypothetical protein GS481_01830 [Rhodococcus hoagii]|nr:hypothetical protein [Prescottella equi]